MLTPVLAFSVLHLFGLLIWAAWVVLSLWAWQKTKAMGYLLLLVGSAGNALFTLLAMLATTMDYTAIGWLSFLCSLVMTFGFYLLVAPLIASRIEDLKTKMHTPHAPPPGGAPPAAPPPAAPPAG